MTPTTMSSTTERFARHVQALAGIYRRLDRGELTGRNATATDRTIDHHVQAARDLLRAELNDDASPLFAALDRRPKLAAKWNAIERRYYGLPS